MAHKRPRWLEEKIKSAMKWSPAVGLVGMRQTGKTTLFKGISKSYFTFDDEGTFAKFEIDGLSVLQAGPYPMILDEAQKAPFLFNQIKTEIDRRKTPGRFGLTGSVRFSAREAIRESLTGRVVTFELLPLTLGEAHERSEPTFFIDCWKEQTPERLIGSLARKAWATEAQVNQYLDQGGLPGICFRREAGIRSQLFQSHLSTILGRDIRLISETKVSILKLTRLLEELAKTQGFPVNFSQLGRQVGVSTPTVKRIIHAFEGLFLCRAHGSTYFCEDLGLGSFLTKGADRMTDSQNLSRFLFREFHTQLSYVFPSEVELTDFSTRGGAFVPFVIGKAKSPSLAIGLDADVVSSEKTLKGLGTFRKHHKSSKLIAIHKGKQAYISSTDIPCIPWTWIV